MNNFATSADLRASRRLLLLELALVALLFLADWSGRVFVSKTLYILVLAWVSLRARQLRWSHVGFARYRSWGRTLLWGLLAGAAMSALELLVTQPLLVRLTGEMPDLHQFQRVTGNVKWFLIAFVISWTLAALGEELVYRGYLMSRVADLFGRTRAAWVTSLLAVSLLFGAAHMDQGITGMIENFINGLLLGGLYLRCQRNLAVPIVAHGITDTVDFLLIFLGKYPGM